MSDIALVIQQAFEADVSRRNDGNIVETSVFIRCKYFDREKMRLLFEWYEEVMSWNGNRFDSRIMLTGALSLFGPFRSNSRS